MSKKHKRHKIHFLNLSIKDLYKLGILKKKRKRNKNNNNSKKDSSNNNRTAAAPSTIQYLAPSAQTIPSANTQRTNAAEPAPPILAAPAAVPAIAPQSVPQIRDIITNPDFDNHIKGHIEDLEGRIGSTFLNVVHQQTSYNKIFRDDIQQLKQLQAPRDEDIDDASQTSSRKSDEQDYNNS